MPTHELEAPEAAQRSIAAGPRREAEAAAPGAASGPRSSGLGQAGRAVLQLQRHLGNRYVDRALRLARQADEPDAEAGRRRGIAPEIEASIHRKRGGGQPLDTATRVQMEPAMGTDLGGVRVHTDSEADSLNRSVSARAFTTGQDIFFRQGAYNPGSSSGRELLAHELTHVAQQSGSPVQPKLEIGEPGDVYEQEADAVARGVMQQEQGAAAARAGAGPAPLQRQADDEDKETMQAKLEPGTLQRQPEDEEKKDEGQ